MPSPGLSLRVRVMLLSLIPVMVGVIAGVLGFFAKGGVANGLLIGGAAAGNALALVNGLLQRR